MRRTGQAVVVLGLIVAGTVMTLDRRKLSDELTSVKAALATQGKELEAIRRKEAPHPENHFTPQEVQIPVKRAGVPLPIRPSPLSQEGLHQLIRMRDEMEAIAANAEAKVFALARDLNVTVEDLDKRNAPPEHLEPFFSAVHDWKNQIRIAETFEMRIKAEMVDAGQ